MKIRVSLIIAVAVGAFGVAGAVVHNRMHPTLIANMTLHRLAVEQGLKSPNADALDANDSHGAWGLHEPLKSCTPCHGDQADQDSYDQFHLVAPVPKLCYGCHKEFQTLDGWKHGPVATGQCLSCHESHKAKQKSLLKNQIPQLCLHCHETATLRLVPNHADESYSRCDACHDEHATPGRMLLKEEFLKTDAGRAYADRNPSVQPRPTLVDSNGSLEGLEGVEVVSVVYNSDVLKRYGVSEDLLKTTAELKLKDDGVAILEHKEQALRQPSLEIHLRLMEVPSQRRSGQIDALSGSVSIFLRQKVELLSPPGSVERKFCTATTWDTGAAVIWGKFQIEDGLKQAIEVLLGRFGNDYLRANPAKRTDPPISNEK